MLKLLLDEHISPAVATGLRRLRPSISVCGLVEWEGGGFLGQDDAACLRHAAARGWTLATYDRRTIPPLLKTWAEGGQHHGGVIFIDEKTIRLSDIGGQVRGLAALAREAASWEWTDRIVFLRR
ncbi:MAG: hypothetical protein ABR860_00990 [Terracidiphilus sp.]|jgi:hypothetical protein